MTTNQAVRTGKQAVNEAKRATQNVWVERLARAGYVARGLIYAMIGLLAIGLAAHQGGKATDQTGAIQILSGLPYGKFILLALGIGLLGYALWGFVRAIFDPLHKGTDTEGLLARAGFLSSGVTYGALALVAFYYGFGFGLAKAGNPQDMSANFFKLPFGQWLVVLFGLLWIAIAFGQFYIAYKANFERDLNLKGLDADERNWADKLGRFGYASRGVVFLLIGWFLVQAGMNYNPSQAKGVDGALLALNSTPLGTLGLAIVALGLVAFGVFSILCARWVVVPKAR